VEKQEKVKTYRPMLRSRPIGKQSEESVESVLRKKQKATAGRICRNKFMPGMKE